MLPWDAESRIPKWPWAYVLDNILRFSSLSSGTMVEETKLRDAPTALGSFLFAPISLSFSEFAAKHALL